MTKITDNGYRFSPEIIHQSIWLYLRFALRDRDVEDLLDERGIANSYETIRRWVNYFEPIIAERYFRPMLKVLANAPAQLRRQCVAAGQSGKCYD